MNENMISQEEFIINFFETTGKKTYYDLGAYPNKETIELFSRLIDLGIDIYAFEPAPDPFKLLKEKFGETINSFNLGASDKNETLILYNLELKHGASTYDLNFFFEREDPEMKKYNLKPHKVFETESRTVRLSDFIKENNLPNPDLIKMDVENWEDKVLKGIDFSLYKPILIIEGHSDKTISFLKEYLKKLYKIEKIFFLDEKFNHKRYYFYLESRA